MRSSNSNPVRSSITQLETHEVIGLGAATAISKVSGGDQVTVTRTGTGAYTVTFAENPGNFMGASITLQATTPGNLAGHTVIPGAWDATLFALSFIVYNAADAAHDLAALEWFNASLKFSSSNLDIV